MKKQLLLCIWIMTGVIVGCSSEKSHTNKVNIDKVEIVAPNVQGAGRDLTARAMQKTLAEEKIFTKPITVTNKVGGSGDVGWKYTKQKGGHVLAINSSLLITNNLLGHSKLTYKDFTPLATLASDWEVVVVSKDSTIDNANELMEQLKQNKKNFKIGVAPGLGNDDHLSFVQVSKAFGINPAELQFFVYENKEKNHKRPNEQTNKRCNYDLIRSRKTIQSRQNKNTSRIRTKTTRPPTRNPNMERTRNQRHLPALERNYGPERYDGGRGCLLG